MVLRKEEEREESRRFQGGVFAARATPFLARAGSVFLEIAVHVNGIFCDIAPSERYVQVRVVGCLVCRYCRERVAILPATSAFL